MTIMEKKVIVAPLNWGLGHASRCIPIVHLLIKNNFTPIIASDGKALVFLQKEFPKLTFLELPSYSISYGKHLKWRLFLQLPKIFSAVKKERKIIANFLKKEKNIVGIISDNRFGVRSTKVASVYITHQLQVLSGFTTFFTSKIHQSIIKKFDECWIPDNTNSEFSGKLSQVKNKCIQKKYIGVLSRFKKENIPITTDILIILSGPEPNRTQLENRLVETFKNTLQNIVLVQGKIEDGQKKTFKNNICIYNFLLSNELEKIINASKIVLCRSGYSSIMDVAVLHKKVFFIPTKYQTEQEYLAKHLKKRQLAPFTNLKDFTLKKLEEIENYKGLKAEKTALNADLFRLFNRK